MILFTRSVFEYLKRALIVTALCMGLANAQNLTADQLIETLKEEAQAFTDAQTLITGYFIDLDGTRIDIEIELDFMNKQRAGRAYFIEPAALADNFIVLDGDVVYNYLFLTNQVTVFNAGDPDAFGGIFPDIENDGEDDLVLGFNPDRMFRGWDAEVLGYESSAAGDVYVMRYINSSDPESEIGSAVAHIIDGEWYPYHLKFYDFSDALVAEITLNNFVRDPGLDRDDIVYIPDDAEVIDER